MNIESNTHQKSSKVDMNAGSGEPKPVRLFNVALAVNFNCVKCGYNDCSIFVNKLNLRFGADVNQGGGGGV